MSEIPENVQGGFDAEFESMQETRRRIESNTNLNDSQRAALLGRLAEREMAHVARVQRASEEAQQNEVLKSKVRTAQQQGGVGVRHTAGGGVEVQHQAPQEGVPPSLNPEDDTALAEGIVVPFRAEGVPPALARDMVTAPTDIRGSLPTEAVAGTPRSARRRSDAERAAVGEAPTKGAPYTDPYDPNTLYDYDGPISEIRRSFLEQGKIEQQAGLQSAADVMAAADEIRAQREAAYQRMREDLLSQEQQLRELDVQLSSLREMQFDSDRLFRNGHGVSLALGMAVGAMQQTLNNALFPGSNAPNTAMQLVQDAIDRDLREQAVNYQRGVTNLGMARTSYEMARQLGMDHQAAYQYAAATAEDYVARQLNAHRLTMGAGVAAQEATRQEQELRMRAMERKEASLMALAQLRGRQIGSGRPAGGSVPVAPRTRLRAGANPREAQRQIGTTTWNNIQSTATGADDVLSLLDQLRPMIMNNDAAWFSQNRGTIESLRGQLTAAVKGAYQLGALDNGVERLVDSIVANPTDAGGMSIWRNRILGQMAALRGETIRRAQSIVQLNGQGLLEWDPNLTVRPNDIPEVPGFESEGDQAGPEDDLPGRAANVVRAVAENPGAAARTVSTGVAGALAPGGARVIEEGISQAVSAFQGGE